jgi:hypothetical protein
MGALPPPSGTLCLGGVCAAAALGKSGDVGVYRASAHAGGRMRGQAVLGGAAAAVRTSGLLTGRPCSSGSQCSIMAAPHVVFRPLDHCRGCVRMRVGPCRKSGWAGRARSDACGAFSWAHGGVARQRWRGLHACKEFGQPQVALGCLLAVAIIPRCLGMCLQDAGHGSAAAF